MTYPPWARVAVSSASTSAFSDRTAARRSSSGMSPVMSATETGPTHWPVTGQVRLNGFSPTR